VRAAEGSVRGKIKKLKIVKKKSKLTRLFKAN
jgi:hypothetical protein